MRIGRAILFLAFLVGACLGAQTPERIIARGLIVDATTALPLPRVRVLFTRATDTLAVAVSDSGGAFTASLATGDSVEVHFRRLGYRADSTRFAFGGGPLRVALPHALPLKTLAAVNVRGARTSTDFDRRARRNAGGRFFTLEDIEKAKPVNTADLFRTLPGVTQLEMDGVLEIFSQRATRTAKMSRSEIEAARNSATGPVAPAPALDGQRQSGVRNCAMRVAVDGMLMPEGFSVNDIRPTDIYGIEFYVGAAEMPAEFSSVHEDVNCGLVMIWTKRGRDKG